MGFVQPWVPLNSRRVEQCTHEGQGGSDTRHSTQSPQTQETCITPVVTLYFIRRSRVFMVCCVSFNKHCSNNKLDCGWQDANNVKKSVSVTVSLSLLCFLLFDCLDYSWTIEISFSSSYLTPFKSQNIRRTPSEKSLPVWRTIGSLKWRDHDNTSVFLNNSDTLVGGGWNKNEWKLVTRRTQWERGYCDHACLSPPDLKILHKLQ